MVDCEHDCVVGLKIFWSSQCEWAVWYQLLNQLNLKVSCLCKLLEFFFCNFRRAAESDQRCSAEHLSAKYSVFFEFLC